MGHDECFYQVMEDENNELIKIFNEMQYTPPSTLMSHPSANNTNWKAANNTNWKAANMETWRYEQGTAHRKAVEQALKILKTRRPKSFKVYQDECHHQKSAKQE
jgi:hypothetical protein